MIIKDFPKLLALFVFISIFILWADTRVQAAPYPETCLEFEGIVSELTPKTNMETFLLKFGDEDSINLKLYSRHEFEDCTFNAYWIFTEEQKQIIRSARLSDNGQDIENLNIEAMVLFYVVKEDWDGDWVIWPKSFKDKDLEELAENHYKLSEWVFDEPLE